MASSAIPASSEQQELALLNRQEFRIAAIESEAKLSTHLRTFLAPILLKLASEHLTVRNKVIAICQHLNVRVKPQTVELPVAALLQQMKDHLKVPLIIHFDLLYAQQGFKRMGISDQAAIFPILASGAFRTLTADFERRAAVFHLLLLALKEYRLPARGSKEDDDFRTQLELTRDDAVSLSNAFAKLMLFTGVRLSTQTIIASPGLSSEDIAFLTMKGDKKAWDPSSDIGLNLSSTKLKVLSFLASGAFRDDERFLPALFAASDSNSNVAQQGDQILKYSISNVNFDNVDIIEHLYSEYPLSKPAVQVKILTYLSKSKISTRYPQLFMKIIESGINGDLGGSTGPTVSGLEQSRLRSAIFSYVNFYLRNADQADVQSVSGPLIELLRNFILGQGWPSPAPGHDQSLRKSAYEMIGLAAKARKLADIALLKWFFTSLRDDLSDKEIGLSITESMSNLVGQFARESAQNKDKEKELSLLLLDFMEADAVKSSSTAASQAEDHHMDVDTGAGSSAIPFRRNTRYAAVRFTNRCLPFANPLARWINILAVAGLPGDPREVGDEGKKGLDPYWFRLLNSDNQALWRDDSSQPKEPSKSMDLQDSIIFPRFEALIGLFFTDRNGLSPKSEASAAIEHLFGLPATTFTVAMQFCRAVFLYEALQHSDIRIAMNDEWARNLEIASLEDSASRRGIKDYIRSLYESKPLTHKPRPTLCDWNGFQLFLEAAFGTFSHLQLDVSSIRSLYDWKTTWPGEMFTQLLPLIPDDDILLKSGLADRFHILKESLTRNEITIRRAAARAFGILFSALDEPTKDQVRELEKMLNIVDSWENVTGARTNMIDGYIEALSVALSRAQLRDQKHPLQGETERLLAVAMAIINSSSDSTLLNGALTAVSELGVFTDSDKAFTLGTSKFSGVVGKVSSLAEKSNEKAVRALGRITIRLSEDVIEEAEALERIDAALYKLHESRDTEAQFAIGEALCCVACSWDCKPLELEFDVNAQFPTAFCRDKTLVRMLERTIADCSASKPSLCKASVIWLLCFVQFCGQRDEVQQRLPQCQAAFMACLSDRNTLVQEAASRGLGLVYEKGDRNVKDDLVRQLVRSFTGNKSTKQESVSEDTELFNLSSLLTGDGSTNAYGDILSLAAEVGDPTLVYHFFSVVANSAIWKSAATFGKFGLSNVFEDSSAIGYLVENPKIYPKLYRYRFDPNPTVRRSMDTIWAALVKDTNGLIDERFDDIVQDLLSSILTRSWKVRAASCDAIVDLVQSRQFERSEQYFSDIWAKCFKVLDDMKPTVQIAAARLAKVLTSILVRNLEASGSSATTTALLGKVLPFLMSSSGLESRTDVVQAFSLRALQDIIKKASPTVLRPLIPDLIERLIGLSTDMESGTVNYLRQHAAEYDVTEQDVDDIRIKALRMGPWTESIERCLDMLDDETVAKLVPALERAVKSAIDLPSKVTFSRIVVSLSTRHRALFQPYADRFLSILERYIVDRNDTVSSAYATAAGYISRLASDKQILRTVLFAKKIFSTSENDRDRVTSGVLMEAIAKNAKDRFANLASDILPFIFIAKHDGADTIKELYNNVWQDNTGGSRAVQLYLHEIIALSEEWMDSPRWNVKHTAALAIASATNALASTLDGISAADGEKLWPAIGKALSGKSWDGKGSVMLAFKSFVEKGQRYWKNRPEVQDEFLKVSNS